MKVIVRLTEQAIDSEATLRELDDPTSGALATFVGRVRDHHEGRSVEHLVYSAHASMAEAQMRRIADDTLARWTLTGVAIVHRVGRLEIGDAAVLVAAASAHRAESFAACRHMIETLKHDVPIWKHEHYGEGDPRWIGSE